METAHTVGGTAMQLGQTVGENAMQFGHTVGGTAMQLGQAVGGTAMQVGHAAMDTVESLTNLVSAGGETIVNNGIKPVNNLVINGFNFATRPFFGPIRFPNTFF